MDNRRVFLALIGLVCAPLPSKVPTAPGAGTSLWVAEVNRLFVAAPANEKQEAQVLIFEPQP